MVYFLFFIGVLITSTAQLLLKTGVNQLNLLLSPKIILQILTNKFLFLGFLLYGIGSIMWLFIIKKLPISIAYPAVSVSYIIVILSSYFLFKEPLTVNKIIGGVLIMSGIAIMFYKAQ